MNNSNKLTSNKGFTLVECLLALSITSLSMVLLSTSLPLLKRIQISRLNIEDEIALIQVRKMLLYSHDILFSQDELLFYTMGKEASLLFHEDRLVKVDGFVIYMENIPMAYFTKKKGCIYLNYEREFTVYERFLTCQ